MPAPVRTPVAGRSLRRAGKCGRRDREDSPVVGGVQGADRHCRVCLLAHMERVRPTAAAASPRGAHPLALSLAPCRAFLVCRYAIRHCNGALAGPAARCGLSVACCPLHVVRYMLSVACCPLHVVAVCRYAIRHYNGALVVQSAGKSNALCSRDGGMLTLSLLGTPQPSAIKIIDRESTRTRT